MDQIEVKSFIPKFITFYEKATKQKCTKEERWNLWKEHYNFAAIPPGPDGQTLAKELLEHAWDQYEERFDYIKNWEPEHQKVADYLSEIKSLLGCEDPIKIVIIYFVGAFENNAFVAPYDDERLALCLPIENGNSDITLCHELTHVVHIKSANMNADWQRTIASIIIQEGLATHVSKKLVPGKEDRVYIEHEEGWLASCRVKKSEMIHGIRPYLNDDSSETVYKFTMGTGSTNTEREAYYVGWEIVKALFVEGYTFEEIASVKVSELPNWLHKIYPLVEA
ncbi:DUF2268 domain-containing putative Zn-dependent protease [Allobacillus sp. GCM10007491]|uniref:DUF2268 domain-containing protein n=1 Tax=Allobacillus saliphilus TaxID=2912308 RepID=A0A941CUL8_9BACI|nr:DUF2268 domain-containing putative Zn-dependent protease [Allobacillus saliphilus]MBR7552693.1 hypothetical protein [Allobacillus saliphilus]